MIKRILFALILIGSAVGVGSAQQYNVVYTPTSGVRNSPNNYVPWLILPGFSRPHWVELQCEIDTVTAWSVDGSGNATFTTNNTLTAGDIIRPRNFWAAGGGQFDWQVPYTVVSATSTQVVIHDNNFSAGSGTEGPQALLTKVNGANCAQTGTWSIQNSVGGGTYRLRALDGLSASPNSSTYSVSPSLTSAQAYVWLDIGLTSTAVPDCQKTGAFGAYVFSSPVQFDLVWKPDQDPTHQGVFHYNVCKPGANSGKGAIVYAHPGYRQAYKQRDVPIDADILGNSNLGVHWAITAYPAGSGCPAAGTAVCGSIDHADFPEAIFHTGTTSGEYEITAISDADATAKDYNVIYVASQATPAYALNGGATPEGTEPVPCESDPALIALGATYNLVGPSQTIPDLRSIPGTNYHASNIYCLVNEDTTGSNPTTFHQYMQFKEPTSGTYNDAHHPMVVVGSIPDSQGHLPVIDGTNATGNPGLSVYTSAPNNFISFAPTGAYGYYTHADPLMPMRYISVSGIKFINGHNGVPFTMSDGTPATWGFTTGARAFFAQYVNIIGTRADYMQLGTFDDANTQNAIWKGEYLDYVYEGMHISHAGSNGSSTDHSIYTQGRRGHIRLSVIDGVVAGSGGDAAKSDRGSRSFFQYNRMVPVGDAQSGGQTWGHSELQDDYYYSQPDFYFGLPGETDPVQDQIPAGNGDEWDVNGFAALWLEHDMTEFNIGNIYKSLYFVKTIGFTTTHGGDTGINNPMKLNSAYNTYTMPQVTGTGQTLFEDVRPDLSDFFNVTDFRPHVWPNADFQNDLFAFGANPADQSNFTMNVYAHAHERFQSIMVANGQIRLVNPLNQGNQTAGFTTNIWNLTPTGTFPLNGHLEGYNSGNILTYSTYPLNPTNFAPLTGSAPIGQATALTGQLAYYPPLYNAVNPDGSWTRRTNLTTLGAMDPPAATGHGRTFGTFRTFGTGTFR